MGTRAIIYKDDKPYIFCHFDGYPRGLGEDLLKAGTDKKKLLEVAIDHSVDYAHKSLLEAINEERVKKLMVRHNLSRTEIIKGGRRGCIDASDDHLVSDITGLGSYRSWAEWHYQLMGKKWMVRPSESTEWREMKKGEKYD